MAFAVGHVRAALNTATGNQSFTIAWSDGGSHTPTGALFEVTKATADGVAANGAVFGVGATDGTNDRAAATWSEDAVGTSNCDKYTTASACIAAIDAGVVDFLATSVSFASNTVTVNITNAPSAAWLIKVVAFSGTSAIEVGTANPATTNLGTVNKTGLGQSANAVICITASSVTSNFAGSVLTNSAISYGFYSWDGTTARQAMMAKTERNGRGTVDANAVWYDGRVSMGSDHNWGSRDQSWALTNHASGFTITTYEETTIDVDHDFFYLAMALPSGVEAYAGNFQSPTTASPTDKAITAPGFTPQALMMLSSHIDAASKTGESATPDADAFSSGSAISASSEFGMSYTVHDGQATSNTQSRTDSVISTVVTDTGTVAIQGNLKSLDATGFTIEYTANVNAKAGRVVYLAFQEDSASSPQNFTTSPAAITVAVPDPTFGLGNVNFASSPAAITVGAADVTFAVGGQNFDSSPAAITVTAVDPSFVVGNVNFVPTPAAITVAVPDPVFDVAGTQNFDTSPAAITVAAVDPTFTIGAINFVTSPAAITVTAVDVVFGDATALATSPAVITVTAVDVTYVRGILLAPPGLEAVRSAAFTEVDLYWDPVDGAGQYKVLQGTDYKDTMAVVNTVAVNAELMTAPKDLTNAAWTKAAATIESNSDINAFGKRLADRIVVNTDVATSHYWFQTESGASANTHFVCEIEVKKPLAHDPDSSGNSPGTYLSIRVREQSPTNNYSDVFVDLVTGIFAAPADTGDFVSIKRQAVDLGTYWLLRVIVKTGAMTGSGNLQLIPIIAETISDYTFDGDGATYLTVGKTSVYKRHTVQVTGLTATSPYIFSVRARETAVGVDGVRAMPVYAPGQNETISP